MVRSNSTFSHLRSVVQGSALTEAHRCPSVCRCAVCVKDGLIAEVAEGGSSASGTREVDASGKLVTPGWVDIRASRTAMRARLISCAAWSLRAVHRCLHRHGLTRR